jgi:hypothetical protein
MSESKFLRWQDKNGDNLIDVCEIDLPRPEEKICLDCIPNPRAIVPRWRKKRNLKKPFLNEKLCKYQIVNITERTDTGAHQFSTPQQAQQKLNEIYEEYARETVEALLTFYDKDKSEGSINKILDVLEYTDYHLDARPLSHLKLLYSVPFSDLNEIPAADAEEEEEVEADDVVTTYIPSILIPNMIRVRKGLNLYASNLKVYRALDGKNLVFKDGGIFNLDLYGDYVMWGDSITEEIIPELSEYLAGKNLYLGSTSMFFPSKAAILKFECTFSPEYKVKQLRVWFEGCADDPNVYKGASLDSLNDGKAFRDPTAMAYFSRIDDMERDLTARNPKPWVEFIKEYTYPEVVEVTRNTPSEIDPLESAFSCIADSLSNDFKQFGQDALDDVFSIGDAIAAQFHKSLCQEDYVDFLNQEYKLGKYATPSGEQTANSREEDRRKNIKIMALEQAYGELNDRNVLMTSMCSRVLSICGGAGTQATLDKLWGHALDPLRLCGLFDLTLDAIQCLFRGLTFEEVLASMLKSSLRAMSIEHFGDLFLGLPPERQAKLDQLVKRKLASGDIAPPGRLTDTSDTPDDRSTSQPPQSSPFYAEGSGFFGTILGVEFEKPWENPDLVERQKTELMNEGPYESVTPSGVPVESQPVGKVSNLAKATAAAQVESTGSTLSPNVVMEAYILALLEEYSDDLLSLLTEVEKFPGAQVIAYIIATLDCPRPPLFDPSLMDFLKDIELPFCRNTIHIGLPRLENPFAYLPKLWDIFRILWAIAKQELWNLVVRLVCKLIVFVCELLGDALCKALETAGQMAASLPSVLGGRTTFSEVIKETICGPGSDQAQIEATMEEMFNNLGQGGAALADKTAVMSFAEDLSSTTTRSELTNAMLGEPSQSFLDIIESLVEFEYPEFADTFGNSDKAAAFFKNVGNVMPVSARAALKEFADTTAEDSNLPANPSLCATPEEVEEFCTARAALLEGRASPDQIEAMCAAGRNTFKDDLAELGDIIQNGIPNYFEQNMPAIMSSDPDPTCDNGLIPYEPKEIAVATTVALDSALDVLKISYSQDMLGNGPFVQSNWGFLNMVLSDTMGWAYTTHVRKSLASGGWFTKRSYVDFNVSSEIQWDNLNFKFSDSNYANTFDQQGALPLYVADHLLSDETNKGEMERAVSDSTFVSNNEYQPSKDFSRDFRSLGFDNYLDEVDLLVLPDYGYNVTVSTEFSPFDFGDGKVIFTRNGRKKTPDLKLQFRDNAQGEKRTENGYSYGFNIKLYLSDLISDKVFTPIPEEYFPEEFRESLQGLTIDQAEQLEDDVKQVWLNAQAAAQAAGISTAGTIHEAVKSRSDDNARILIEKVINQGVMEDSNASLEAVPEDTEVKRTTDSIITYRAYEFLSTDDGLDNEEINEGGYVNFKSALAAPSTNVIPQVVLLQEMIEKQSGEQLGLDIIKSTYDQVMTTTFDKLAREIYTNLPAFEYGAQLDDLSPTQIEYGVAHEGQFMLYKDYLDSTEIDIDDGPLGISRMQYDEENNNGPPNRVFYLDPLVYGGSNQSPAIHLKPSNKTGWLGMVDVMFPDLSPCKPQHTDLVDFGQIQNIMNNSYSKIPEDERLKSDPDCVTEKPYNRILERASKAGIEGMIHAMCRIFVSVNFLKSLATFTKFKPDFRNVFSSLYAGYVVEIMEEELKDAQSNDFLEFFSPFKDDEFWYAFLEQAVQTYARKVEVGEIEDVPPDVLNALEKLTQFQTRYRYPGSEELDTAKDIGDAHIFQTLKNYRYEKNLEAVKSTEEWAKIILKEFVIQEMDFMSNVFMDNLKNVGIVDSDTMITNLGYYVLEELTSNTDLTLNKELKEEVQGLPSEGDNHYTNGAELATPDGEPYVGYYHTHIDDQGDLVYMVGETHTPEEHDTLRPFANKVIVPIGSIGAIGSVVGTTEKPFIAETYVRVNNNYMTPDEAVLLMAAQPDRSLNISDVWPGTLELVIDPESGQVLGTQGELGVRFGLRFSIQVGSTKQQLIEVEVDALDLPIEMFQPLERDSKLLLCLINNLVDGDRFRALKSYVFPMNKILSTLAIYNDMAFLPSIGEVTTTVNSSDVEEKPGKYVVIDTESGGRAATLSPGAPGWAKKAERETTFGTGFFTLHFDKWNRSVIVKSKARVKRLFNDYYNSRDFDPGDVAPDIADSLIASLKAAYSRSPGERHFPWFKKGLLRTNPFNANGELCKKSD